MRYLVIGIWNANGADEAPLTQTYQTGHLPGTNPKGIGFATTEAIALELMRRCQNPLSPDVILIAQDNKLHFEWKRGNDYTDLDCHERMRLDYEQRGIPMIPGSPGEEDGK